MHSRFERQSHSRHLNREGHGEIKTLRTGTALWAALSMLSRCIGIGDGIVFAPPLELHMRIADNTQKPLSNKQFIAQRTLWEYQVRSPEDVMKCLHDADALSQVALTTDAGGNAQARFEKSHRLYPFMLVGIVPIPPFPPRRPKPMVVVADPED